MVSYKLKDTSTPMDKINGYVLALYDVSYENGQFQWFNGIQNGQPIGTVRDGFYGYQNFCLIRHHISEWGHSLDNFPVIKAATKYYETQDGGKCASPDNTSGWFLPSKSQCQYWLDNKDVLLASVKKATDQAEYAWKSSYFSSSEKDYLNVWRLLFGEENTIVQQEKNASNAARSILAF